MKKQVNVKPSSKQARITEEADGSLTVRLVSQPVDGKANRELIRLLARYFGVAQRDIILQAGATGRRKIIEIIEL